MVTGSREGGGEEGSGAARHSAGLCWTASGVGGGSRRRFVARAQGMPVEVAVVGMAVMRVAGLVGVPLESRHSWSAPEDGRRVGRPVFQCRCS